MSYYGGGNSIAGDGGISIGDANTSVDVFAIKKGDREPVLRRTLTDASGAVLSLEGGDTVVFNMGIPGESVKVNAGACTIIDGPGGVVEYAWADGDTSEVGTFRGEFQITRAVTLKKRTVPTRNWLRIKVYEEIA
jgi:hypothetical protein